MTTIAIAHPDNPNDVKIWCDVEKVLADGTIVFYVINGAWKGKLFTDNTLQVADDAKRIPAIKVWEGLVPRPYNQDYNLAIPWINAELNREQV